MKIQPGMFPVGKTIQRGETPPRAAQSQSFGDMMQQQDEQRTHEELQRKLEDIRMQGERLTRSMTIRELVLYRQMVKAFLEDTVRRGIALKERKAGTAGAGAKDTSSSRKSTRCSSAWEKSCCRAKKAVSNCSGR